ncbi:MAG: hypothetical protein H6Q19_315 [Bacteroidetes bacterium]|nr:hypothetical protein [Bacteroidota bacterium]
MKKLIKVNFLIFLLLGIYSCQNEENEFSDYKYTTIYFPYQTPIRTLVLGDYDQVDNTKDNKLQFSIGVTMGGIYENKKDRKVGYVLDETLTNNLFYIENKDTVRIKALPQAYYTLSPAGTMTIPKDKMYGFIDVQLTDAFLNDTNTYKNRYVIPLLLTNSESDSILRGKTVIPDIDRRVADGWDIVPKDYTLFMIKYINPYHGKFLYRGKDVVTNSTGTKIDEVIYRNKYLEKNIILPLQTTGRNIVEFTSIVRRTSGSPGNFKASIEFNSSDNTCTISTAKGSAFAVAGTGKFIREGEEWGSKKRNTIILDYKITDSAKGETHQVNDTLVIRDRAVVLETFKAVVK